MLRIDARTIILLTDKEAKKVLLLRRIYTKRLFPNMITGIGGAVEFELGENGDIIASALRELEEETKINSTDIGNLKWRLTTIRNDNNNQQIVLFWLIGQLYYMPSDLSCNEGLLEWWEVENLPIIDMVPTAKSAIPFVLGLDRNKDTIYQGVYSAAGTLITNFL